ncbi:MAG: rhodanese-like domain-containing protein [bacterium]
MLKRWTWLVLVMIALTAFWGCSDDDDPTDVTTETAFEIMAAAGADYINDSVDCPGVISAQTLHDNLDAYTVIDIRREADYLNGHIPGAYNSSLATILDDLAAKSIPTDKPYVVTCYSGQSAGFVKIAMELMGYDDVKTLGFGMCSWNEATAGGYYTNRGNTLANPETENNNGDLVEFAYPVLGESKDTVVADRVSLTLAGGFKAKTYTSIMDNLESYFIVNYFGEADYLGTGSSGVPGHIPGAFQFTPYQSLGIEQMLKYLPTDMPIVVYCWTGQHSSQVTAYLNMLGYEAYSLSYGSNNLFYDSLTAHKWTGPADYDMEMGPAPTAEFSTISGAVEAYINDATDCPGVITAQNLYDNLATYTVIDIRSATDFATLGHIEGAHNTTLASVLTYVDGLGLTASDPICLVCYSGQSAGHAKVALELSGYENVKTLGFGMSSWNAATAGPWNSNTGNHLTNPETTNNNGDLVGHAYPTLTGATLDDRIQTMLTNGFKGKKYVDIQDYLDDYFVVNYFGEADYLGTGGSGVPGHIPGSFQFTPYESLEVGGMLANLPTDMPIVVYCWTGQHSSQVTAALNILGYETYSLTYGSNNLFYDLLTAHKWTAPADFPLSFD